MKVEIKIYKIFDPDLYAMSAYGIKITNLMKEALEHYVRGEYIHFHVPKSLTYDFSLKKRSVHLAMDITDPESIAFLKKNIKPRYRTAFLKSLLRGSFSTPQLGAFLSNETANKKDTRMIKLTDFENLSNLKELTVSQNPKRDYLAPVKEDNNKKREQTELRSQLKENSSKKDAEELEEKTKTSTDKTVVDSNPGEQKFRKNKKKKQKKNHLEDKFGIKVNPQKETNQTQTNIDNPQENSAIKQQEAPILVMEDEDDQLPAPTVVLEDVEDDEGEDGATLNSFEGLMNTY
jgi:hypothetical protein